MKILFVTGLYPYEIVDELRDLSKGKIQNAPNVFQWNIVEGLADNNADFEVVSLPFLPGFPNHYKRLYTPQSDIVYNGNCVGKMLSYNDLFFIKHISIERRLKRYLLEWLKLNYDATQELWVISYTPYSFFSRPIVQLKHKYPRLKYCAIIADLIDDATDSTFKLSLFKRIQARREQKFIWSSYKDIDKFVLLSKLMEEKISEAVGRNIVIEGLASKVDNSPVEHKTQALKVVLYTGTLQTFTGILDLIAAFKATTDETYRLVICGDGPLSNEILFLSHEDKRIEFKGNLPRNEAVRLQKEATLLVNPRKANEALTRYSFPSKIMEYMASGTPMLAYRLDGIPHEYYSHIYVPQDTTVEGLTSALNEILSLSPETLQCFGDKAKEFIRENKEAAKQVYKILKFLEV